MTAAGSERWPPPPSGPGFGGSVWALVDRDDADGFAAEWLAGYVRAHPEPGSRAATLVTRPAGPAHPLGD